ncbi:hypothetical protein HMN09_00267600 [Mycena chlorophos]|uniref:Uncharacterized protein n=1 Tax=Mycena chlorophos TaxID=658473 RepID=A0A8H6TMC0_MYCCL|nr:hypothetical protein HMN09_00267600 [Mycena chlorophos]
MFFSTLLPILATIAAVSAVGIPARREEESNLVLTPGGHADPANVLQVPDGAHISRVGENFHVAHPDGSLFAKVPISTTASSKVLPESSGWVTYASWVNSDTSTPITKFTTNFVVPPAPKSYTGQTVFLFPGLMPETGTSILQPVLQYGPSAAGGGEYWAVASWYVPDDGAYFVTSLVKVSAGQSLEGIMSLGSFNVAENTYSYSSSMSPMSQTLNVDLNLQLNWASITLESYNLNSASAYPAGTTEFSNVYIELSTGQSPTTSWSLVQDTADEVTTAMEVNSMAGNGVAVITY